MNTAGITAPAAPAIVVSNRGSAPVPKPAKDCKDCDDLFGTALQQSQAAAHGACVPMPLLLPPAEDGGDDGATVNAASLLGGEAGTTDQGEAVVATGALADGTLPFGKDGEAGDAEVLHAFAAQANETEEGAAKQGADVFSSLKQRVREQDAPSCMAAENQSPPEVVAPAVLTEQQGPHAAEMPQAPVQAAALAAQPQPSHDRPSVHFAEKPLSAEGMNRFEQTLSITRDGNRLAVSLEPDGLGKLEINLSMEHGLVHARIHVADDSARTLLANHQQQILDALAREGLNVGGFSVSLRNSGSGQEERSSQQEQDRPAPDAAAPAYGTGPDRPGHQGMVSIFI